MKRDITAGISVCLPSARRCSGWPFSWAAYRRKDFPSFPISARIPCRSICCTVFLIKLMSKTRLFGAIEHDLIAALLISLCLVTFLSWKPLVRLLFPLMQWDGSLLRAGAGYRSRRMKKSVSGRS